MARHYVKAALFPVHGIGYGLGDREIRVRFPSGTGIFLFSIVFTPALGPTPPTPAFTLISCSSYFFGTEDGGDMYLRNVS
jgi:hypothetical protein